MKFTILLVTLAFAYQSQAADGSSGCGPGWYILKNNSLLSSALRSTTNGLLAPVTTIGMTFGTSNCTRHGIVKKEKETLHFVTHNYFEIKAQAAMGKGSHIVALAQTMGCNQSASELLGQSLKNSYKEIFPSTNSAQPENSLVHIFSTILKQPGLARQCDFPQLG